MAFFTDRSRTNWGTGPQHQNCPYRGKEHWATSHAEISCCHGATPTAGHFMLETFANQIQAAFGGATSSNETQKAEQAAAEKAVIKDEFQGEWTISSLLSSLTADVLEKLWFSWFRVFIHLFFTEMSVS
uniref:uncharacterized protein LOC143311908 n=1 Tax=Arvicanthis niloticus TaxID=61156 RepID=UPI00402B29B5